MSTLFVWKKIDAGNYELMLNLDQNIAYNYYIYIYIYALD